MKYLQIDIKKVSNDIAQGYLMYDGRSVAIIMPRLDYERLIQDGLFVRSGSERDGAGVLNTTASYVEVPLNTNDHE